MKEQIYVGDQARMVRLASHKMLELACTTVELCRLRLRMKLHGTTVACIQHPTRHMHWFRPTIGNQALETANQVNVLPATKCFP